MNAEVEEIDAPADSSTALDRGTVETPEAVIANSATAGDQDAPPPSHEEHAEAEFNRHLAKSRGEPDPATVEEAETPETPENEVPEGQKPEAKAAADLSQSESEKTFTKRPEWLRVTKIVDSLGKEAGKEVRTTLRELFEKETVLTQELTKARPAVEWVTQYAAEAGGELGVANTLKFFKTFNHDPANAVPFLEQALADARKRAGLVIQSPDLIDQQKQLEQAVADGAITPEQAEQRRKELTEVESSRAVVKRVTAKTEAEQRQAAERQQAEQQAQWVQQTDAAEAAWTEAKGKVDPDFATLKPTFDKFAQLEAIEFQTANKRLPNPAEAKQILEKAYADAKKDALRWQPKKRAITPVRDEGTSRNTRQQPVTAREKFEARGEAARKRV